MQLRKINFLVLVITLLLSTSEVNYQNLASKFTSLEQFTGKVWIGHYSNPEDSHYVHQLKFETILNGNAVVQTKRVEELDFEMYTLYYWDPEAEQISFQSLTNKGQLSYGIVLVAEDQIIINGESIDKNNRKKFKQFFQLTAGRKIIDRFYLMINNEWKQRHLINYEK